MKFASILCLSALFVSVTLHGEDEIITYKTWDKPISVSDSLYHAYTGANDTVKIYHGGNLLAYKDKLFIEDLKSGKKIIHAVEIPSGRYVGAFGKYGDGPDEIYTPGNLFPLSDGQIALIDYGDWCIKAFNVDSALTFESYAPHIIRKFSEDECKSGFPDRVVPIHNNHAVARCIHPGSYGGYTQSLCAFDIVDGVIEPFGTQEYPGGLRTSVAASYSDSIVAEVSSTQDVIRLYDLRGNLKRIIHGPSYEPTPSRDSVFYSKAIIADGKLFTVYSGKSRREAPSGKQIVVFDLEGEYLYSYLLPAPLGDMAYSDTCKRLYLSLSDKNSYVYFPIGNNGLDNSNPVSPNAFSTNIDKKEKYNDALPPLTLIDPDNKMSRIVVSEARIKPYRPSDSEVEYYIPLFNQSPVDTIRIDSIAADIPCIIRSVPDFPMIPGLLVSFVVIPDSIPLTKNDVTITVYYDEDKQQKLFVKLLN